MSKNSSLTNSQMSHYIKAILYHSIKGKSCIKFLTFLNISYWGLCHIKSLPCKGNL